MQPAGPLPLTPGLLILGGQFIQTGPGGIPGRLQRGVVDPGQNLARGNPLPQLHPPGLQGATDLKRQRGTLGSPDDAGKSQRHTLGIGGGHLRHPHGHRRRLTAGVHLAGLAPRQCQARRQQGNHKNTQCCHNVASHSSAPLRMRLPDARRLRPRPKPGPFHDIMSFFDTLSITGFPAESGIIPTMAKQTDTAYEQRLEIT